jgi:hypothetical protein
VLLGSGEAGADAVAVAPGKPVALTILGEENLPAGLSPTVTVAVASFVALDDALVAMAFAEGDEDVAANVLQRRSGGELRPRRRRGRVAVAAALAALTTAATRSVGVVRRGGAARRWRRGRVGRCVSE